MKRRRGLPWRGPRPAFAVALAVLAALLQGCGLETIVLLNPPGSGPISETSKFFTIYLTTSNDEGEFRGIEIYYKFYSDLANFEGGLSTYSDVVGAGFRRLTSVRDAPTLPNLPLIPVDTTTFLGDPATITLDFSPLESDDVPGMDVVPNTTKLNLPAQSELRRGVSSDDGTTFKKFYSLTASDGFRRTDPDISALNLSPGTDTVYIGLYALSYGVQDLTTPIYSRAVPLSPISIPILVVE